LNNDHEIIKLKDIILQLQMEIIGIKNRELKTVDEIDKIISAVNALGTEDAYDEGSSLKKEELKPVPEKIVEKPDHVVIEEEHMRIYC